MNGTLVVSPHFDDAVLSAGQTMMGLRDVAVATVFTAPPKNERLLTSFDANCGFRSAGQAVATREREDRRAMAVLGVRQVERVGMVDSQYREDRPERAELVQAIRALIHQYDPAALMAPLGVLHPDHLYVSEVILDVVPELDIPVWVWGDLPNVAADPEHQDAALERLAGRGFTTRPAEFPTGSVDRKKAAVRCYRSQLWALKAPYVYTRERFWRVACNA